MPSPTILQVIPQLDTGGAERTVIEVAQKDPVCFQQATQGRSYPQVAASIRRLCPGSLVTAGRYD